MESLNSLQNFLERHRVKGKTHNFLCLPNVGGQFRQGCFFIPDDKKEEFLEKYIKAVPFFTPGNCAAMVYKPPNRKLQPLTIDVDFRFKEKT